MCYLNRERRGREKGSEGKTNDFKGLYKWALRRIDGGYDRFVTNLFRWFLISMVPTSTLPGCETPGEIYDYWILLGDSAFRQIRGVQEKTSLVVYSGSFHPYFNSKFRGSLLSVVPSPGQFINPANRCTFAEHHSGSHSSAQNTLMVLSDPLNPVQLGFCLNDFLYPKLPCCAIQ